MPTDSVDPTPRPFPPRREPDDAHDASYLAASARMESLRRVSIAFPCEVRRDDSRTEAEQFSKGMKRSGGCAELSRGVVRVDPLAQVELRLIADLLPRQRLVRLRPVLCEP